MPELGVITSGNRRQSHQVRALAGDQFGVIARSQLLALEVSDSAITRALRSGTVHRLHPGVYSVVVPELLSEDGHLLGALFAAGPDAFLSHGTAAWRWQMTPAPPTAIELGVAHRRKATNGLVLHRLGVLPPGDLTWNGRFPSTSVARTLLDLSVRYEPPAISRALAEAEFQHDLRPADVLRVCRRGHSGSAKLRAALAVHAPGHGKAKSRLERRFRALLIRQAIELPERNQMLGPWEVDCLWRDQRVVVELDGRQHARPHQADTDDDRDLWLRRNRYLTRRYGVKQVDEQPDDVIADLLDAFAEAGKLRYAALGCG
jgi:very-short-patch-repair endonuclease